MFKPADFGNQEESVPFWEYRFEEKANKCYIGGGGTVVC